MQKNIYRKAESKCMCFGKILLIMKLSLIFLFIGLQVSASNYAQNKISLKVENISLPEVFEKIEKQSPYRFYFSSDVLPKRYFTSIRAENASLDEVMNKILKGANLSWQVLPGNKIVVVANTDIGPIANPSLRKTITGIVSDNNGVPLDNVSVAIKGTGTGITTSETGRFSINANGGDILVFSRVGYETQEVKVSNQENLEIVLLPAKNILEDVVVVGYGKQKKISSVSAISSIKGEELQFPGRNLSTNLQGQVPGIISFQRSGEPGYDNATFWIRGISTFNGVKNPLVLVDGVPRSFNDIDPNEIETFNILKDASATAVFGAEGANGVILVTTKRGRSQKTQIVYRGEASYLTPLRMPEFLGAVDYLTLYNEAVTNQGQPPVFSESLIEKYRTGLDPDLYPSVNWVDELLRDHTANTRHNLSFRGGTNSVRYFVSGAFYNESGLFKNNALSNYNSNIDLKRYNLRSNIDMDVTKTTLLRVDISTQYLETNYPRAGTGRILVTALAAPPYLYPAVYSDGKIADHPRWSGNRSNPYNLLNHSGYTNEYRTAIQSRVDLEQKLDFITQGLYAKLSTSYDYDGFYSIYAAKTYNSYTAKGRDINGDIIYNQVQSGVGDVVADGQRLTSEKRLYHEASLNYARTFNGLHDVTGMALVYRKDRQPVDQMLSEIQRLPYRKMAYVGRVTYSYDRRYSIEANIGITGSENFTKEHRWGYFPAVGAAWTISNEKFFPKSFETFISSLKLRGSYGLTGNDQIGDVGSNRFLYRGGFNSGTGVGFGYTVGGVQQESGGLIEDRFSFRNISWEKEVKQNYGIDLSLFDYSLNIVADYFRNYRYDILLQRQTVSGVAGFRQSPYQNFGKVTNRGVDASVVYRQKIGSNSTVSLRGNFTYAHNKILEIDEVTPMETWMAQTGNRLNMNYVWVADRLFEESDFDISSDGSGAKTYTLKPSVADQNYFNTGLMPGDIKYKDMNNDGVVNQFDRTMYIGNPYAPEIVYGFGVGYEYAGLSINAFFTGVAKTDVVLGGDNDPYSQQYRPAGNAPGFFPFYFGVDESSLRTMALNRWTESKASQDVLYPRLRPGTFYNNSAPSTWWMRDGSFLRLKTVEIGYMLPQKLIKRLTLSGAKIYMLGYNLLTFDAIKYWDPEMGNANGGMSYPQSRSFTAGIEISF